MLLMTRHIARAVSPIWFCKETQTHSSFPFLFSYCTYVYIMDLGTLYTSVMYFLIISQLG